MGSFHVGDRVIYIGWTNRIAYKKTGTVAAINDGRIGVVFDEFIGGHDLGGLCGFGYGYWCFGIELTIDEDDADEETKFEFDNDALQRLVLGGD